MRRDLSAPQGILHRRTVASKILKVETLGDPTERLIDIYIPHGHDGRGLPLLVDVVGFTAGGPAHTNWKNFGENVPERLDRLIAIDFGRTLMDGAPEAVLGSAEVQRVYLGIEP